MGSLVMGRFESGTFQKQDVLYVHRNAVHAATSLLLMYLVKSFFRINPFKSFTSFLVMKFPVSLLSVWCLSADLFRCLDVTSTHASSTGDYDPNVTPSECYAPKFFRPRDTTSAVLYGPRFHVHPCFDLDVLSHVTLRPT